ncbi:hypothetical protein H257_04115 [Aphanomyces astaci]|uniref:GPI transamidase subunit PIG-U n=2 Tax=Aphanomyces astaci TaxID=112090 RepID=W4GVM2_APHAT|nr:hypothetical protein H257_04115 [Aphanomyces astaci]ETV83371.1 hypothetical protein H257_04115 [Aphanomyces astaci]|eukprot:XP_009826801.1 hypothetical protein H257_04115 [Aphanomyces astaci]
MSTSKVAAVVCAGAALRVGLFACGLDAFAQNRLEYVTPLNSLLRLQEGHFLYKAGVNPYAGDTFHQPPLVLAVYTLLDALTVFHISLRTCLIGWTIFMDVVIALGFASMCRAFLSSQGEQQCERSKIWLNHPPVSSLLAPEMLPATTAAMFLFNPYSVISSLALSTSLVTYASIVWSFSFAVQGLLVHAIVLLALATYLSVYPVVLVVPVLLMIHQARSAASFSTPDQPTRVPLPRVLLSIGLFLTSVGGFVGVSFVYMGRTWDFLRATYVWMHEYPDLTPNIGIFWYFFMELFDRFQSYFLVLLHLHPYLYVLPLFIRLRARPLAFACVLLALVSIFQPYPSLGDIGFALPCFLLHPSSIIGMPTKFVLAAGLGVATVLLPVMGFLWLYPGSGNANFFYNQTLVFQYFYLRGIGQFLAATLRRDKQLDEHVKLNRPKLT